ncbi:hypothetical protein Ahy_B09g098777 [Arachis hypogaea]|uniref:MULE transposase domain-containing protein n=1 Tax=Arachis hypogaea TaxID=3818 RepID=A0A444XS11_ARAHY|nr:hypothetical protein Ahy_B09g098777 [Arachis hypogaea]
MKFIIAEVQSRFNYIDNWKVSYQTLPVWLKAIIAKMLRSLAMAQDGNQNIVLITFAIVEGEIGDAWEFFLTNLRRYIVTRDGMGIISNHYNYIDAAIARSNRTWSPPRA